MKRPSRDFWILVLILVGGAVATHFLGLRARNQVDEPSSYSAGKSGLKALYLGLEKLGFRVGRQTRHFDRIPADARVIISPGSVNSQDSEAISKWVEKGNTLILTSSGSTLGDDNDWFMTDFDHRPPKLPRTVKPEGGRYSRDVERVRIYPSSFIYRAANDDTISIVEVEKGVAVAERQMGRGRVILVTDPSMLANSGIRGEDNFVLISNLVYENAGRGDRVLFAEWSRMPDAAGKDTGPLLGRAGRLAYGWFIAVVLIALLSSARRFGAVHPLKGREERRKGAEFVQAIAGLYRRAEARDAAFSAIYQEFRREIFLRFGVSPEAKPSEAADAVLRARNIDAARLAALLERCEGVTGGSELSDHDAVELVRAIEDFRRELGIARSRDN